MRGIWILARRIFDLNEVFYFCPSILKNLLFSFFLIGEIGLILSVVKNKNSH